MSDERGGAYDGHLMGLITKSGLEPFFSFVIVLVGLFVVSFVLESSAKEVLLFSLPFF